MLFAEVEIWLVEMRQKWPGLYMHSASVANLALRFCHELAIAKVDIEQVATAAMLHDLGKTFLKRSIVDKPGPLSREEWRLMKSHTHVGAEMVSARGMDPLVVEAIYYHHERWDGEGYEGLAGDDIPLTAQILAVADTLDAMTSARVYRQPASVSEALAEILGLGGRQFSPWLVKSLGGQPFFQPASYENGERLRKQLELEKERLAYFMDDYGDTSHPLVYAQSCWVDRLLVRRYRLEKK